MFEPPDDNRSKGVPAKRRDRVAVWISVGVFALTCVIALIVYSRGRGLREHYDDSYITYRYAIQLARGNGLVFNVGDRIDAASSFLYTVVLAAFYRVGIHDLETVALVVGLASAGGIAVVVHRTSLRLTQCGWLSGAVGLLAGVHGLVSGWAVTGMETAFYAFLVTLAVGTGFFRWGPRWVFGLALCLVVLTRVEGLLLGFAWFVEEVVQLRRRGWSADPASNRGAMLVALAGVLTALAFFAFKYSYYGTLLPHTYHLKRLLRPYAPDPMHLAVTWLKTAAVPLVLAVPGTLVLIRRREPGVLGVATFVVLTAVFCASGPRAGWGRYSVQALPAVMILAAVAVDAAYTRIAVLGAGAIVAISGQTAASCLLMLTYLHTFSADQTCRKRVGAYMNTYLDRGQTVLSADLGAIGYVATDFSFVDTVGLTSLAVFDEYRAGRNLDRVFEGALPTLAADTWSPPHRGSRGAYKATQKAASPASLLVNVRRGSRFTRFLQDQGPLFKCRAGSQWFAVGPIGEASPPSPR